MELVNIQYKGTGEKSGELSIQDSSLVISNFLNSSFGAPNDYVELYIRDENKELLEVDYTYRTYSPGSNVDSKNETYSSITLDPEKDARDRGYTRGLVNLQYSFYTSLFNSSYQKSYWIKEISPSRTELKIASQVLSDQQIKSGFDSYKAYISSKNYYPVFFLNFGDSNTVSANNVAFTQDDSGAYLLIKLYEPLSADYDVKSSFWIVDKAAESVSYDVDIQVESEIKKDTNKLRGPNYKVATKNKVGQTTPYYNYENLLESPISSSAQKLASWYQDKAISINVDYSNFSNFVHFSSAVERVNNFYYKLQLIESSSINIANQNTILYGDSNVIASSISAEQKIIDTVIKNFDTYEYFLYFESSSWAWPKRTSSQPYVPYSLTSSQARNFLGGIDVVPTATTQSLLFSASYYDSTNKDLFHNSIPQYLLDDSSNEPFILFLDMVGQHFDNIWIYYKDVTNRFKATNNPNTGISMDMVADALKGLGMKLYTNTNVSDNLYYTLFGINPDGSLLPPTGSEKITAIGGKYVTSSIATLSAETIQDEIYKRLYHNLPYLYKTKGTLDSIKALINIYGIPQDILTIREFGGNFTGSLYGISDIPSNEYKVQIITGSGGNVTGSLTISSSLLSPYTSIQYYKGDSRINNRTIEVGFSPADIINNNISGSLGLVAFDQLIGSPAYMYSSSYAPLVSASRAHFSTYTQRNSIWEYIRLLKFYNNSLFKTIKDFVPARANVSTGIIIKSHLYERNKYARHEPSMSFNSFSQSIDILDVSSDSGGTITESDSTAWRNLIITPYGLMQYTSSKGIEKYTGEFSGSTIDTYVNLPFDQREVSNKQTVTSYYAPIDFGATYQNVTGSVRSRYLLDLDYSTNISVPINYGAVTYSINQAQLNSYNTYTNKNNPFAEVQDYNYNLLRSVYPRYVGSKVQSQDYTYYTQASTAYQGDRSYGKTAAIDKITPQYAYLVSVNSSSFQMPYRTKAQIKYLIDNNENVINLSKTNENWFEVQNIFKSGQWVDVSLFDYDINNPYLQKLNNSDRDFTIWESGYSYSPLIYNASGALSYSLDTPIFTTTTPGTPAVFTTITPGQDNYWSSITGQIVVPYTYSSRLGFTASAVVTPSGAPANTSNKKVNISYTVTNTFRTETVPSYGGGTYLVTIPSGSAATYYVSDATSLPSTWLAGEPLTINIVSEQTVTDATPDVNSYTSLVLEPDTGWKLTNSANQIVLSATQSLYYTRFTSSGSYDGLEAFVFPFSISPNDIVRLPNNSSSRWDKSGEFRVTSVGTLASGSNIGGTTTLKYSAITLNLNRPVSTEYTAGPNGSYPQNIYKYMVLKRLEDETSVYFDSSIGKPITNEGVLFSQYVSKEDKQKSGNVIKSLKQQNLI